MHGVATRGGWLNGGRHATVRTHRMTESPYIARVERRLSPIAKTWQSDYVLITVIDRKARTELRRCCALEKSRYVESRRKSFL